MLPYSGSRKMAKAGPLSIQLALTKRATLEIEMFRQTIGNSSSGKEKNSSASSENFKMCTRFIVDEDSFYVVMPPKPSKERDQKFREWYMRGHGVLCYGERQYAGESPRRKERLMEYKMSGKAVLATESEISKARGQIEAAKIHTESNDRCTLAISLATEATMLCTKDRKLQNDFRNLDIDGKTRHVYPISYQDKPPRLEEQAEFLKQNRCERAAPGNPVGT